MNKCYIKKRSGLDHHLNELRQKVKFNKDLLLRTLKIKVFNDYPRLVYDNSKPIPKVIHYCWFGRGKKPSVVEKCLATWNPIMPDYEIKLWNEDNFPIEQYPFAKEALEKKKWAFIADVCRLHALYYEGGIYLDTDIEIIKPFDKFLNDDLFTGYESLNLIAMGSIGAKPHHPWIGKMLSWYSGVHCDEDYYEIANCKVATKLSKFLYGSWRINGNETYLENGMHIYPRDFFSPPLVNKKYSLTENTHAIHHFTGLWYWSELN